MCVCVHVCVHVCVCVCVCACACVSVCVCVRVWLRARDWKVVRLGGVPVVGAGVPVAVPTAHSSTADWLPAPTAVLSRTTLSAVYHAQPRGYVGSVTVPSKGIPAAAAASRHAAASTIRNEGAGHSLLPLTLHV